MFRKKHQSHLALQEPRKMRQKRNSREKTGCKLVAQVGEGTKFIGTCVLLLSTVADFKL